jgi:thiol-disulfide isomerase/thioredoxin
MPGVRRPLALGGLVAIALAALAAGYYLGTDRPAAPAGAPPPRPAVEVPEVRPVFALQDAEGTLRSITEWDGKALMINFWATWCPPCRREIPLLNELRAEYAPRGFEVVGVAVDFREDVVAYLRETPVNYPVLIGEQDGLDAARAFGMETMGFPFTIFTDAQGRIVTVKVGELHRPEAALILSTVLDLQAGRLDMEAARARIRAGMPATRPGSEPEKS